MAEVYLILGSRICYKLEGETAQLPLPVHLQSILPPCMYKLMHGIALLISCLSLGAPLLMRTINPIWMDSKLCSMSLATLAAEAMLYLPFGRHSESRHKYVGYSLRCFGRFARGTRLLGSRREFLIINKFVQFIYK